MLFSKEEEINFIAHIHIASIWRKKSLPILLVVNFPGVLYIFVTLFLQLVIRFMAKKFLYGVPLAVLSFNKPHVRPSHSLHSPAAAHSSCKSKRSSQGFVFPLFYSVGRAEPSCSEKLGRFWKQERDGRAEDEDESVPEGCSSISLLSAFERLSSAPIDIRFF